MFVCLSVRWSVRLAHWLSFRETLTQIYNKMKYLSRPRVTESKKYRLHIIILASGVFKVEKKSTTKISYRPQNVSVRGYIRVALWSYCSFDLKGTQFEDNKRQSSTMLTCATPKRPNSGGKQNILHTET